VQEINHLMIMPTRFLGVSKAIHSQGIPNMFETLDTIYLLGKFQHVFAFIKIMFSFMMGQSAAVKFNIGLWLSSVF
jgi:hypothetical protein